MTDFRALLAGAGQVPETPFIVRVLGEVMVMTDLTIGTGAGADTGEDVEIVRDALSGNPMWPGTSQAGALRNLATRYLGGADPTLVPSVFGSSEQQSRLHTRDAPSADANIGRRVGNRHDERRAVVDTGALFDVETVCAGTTFRVDWSLHMPAFGDDPKALAAFMLALEQFEKVGVRCGLRKGKGRGEIRPVRWNIQHYDLSTTAGFQNWVERERNPAGWTYTTAAGLIDAVYVTTPAHMEQADFRACRNQMRAQMGDQNLTLDLRIVCQESLGDNLLPTTMAQSEPVLIGAVTAGEEGASPLHRCPLTRPIAARGDGTTDEVPVNSGEAFHALLKRTARWALAGVVSTLPDPQRCARRAEALFAEVFGGPARTAGRPTLLPSRVSGSENAFESIATLDLPHVAIDPLTQGAADHLLFSEQVLVGAEVAVNLVVHSPKPAEVALIFLALRDIKDGLAPPIGHGGTIGHGRVRFDGENCSIRTAHPDPPNWSNWIKPGYHSRNLAALIDHLQLED
jgi:CRISPR/Cas system CSM-associated protein Csm3 (group 7 of RAMP superfamily)